MAYAVYHILNAKAGQLLYIVLKYFEIWCLAQGHISFL